MRIDEETWILLKKKERARVIAHFMDHLPVFSECLRGVLDKRRMSAGEMVNENPEINDSQVHAWLSGLYTPSHDTIRELSKLYPELRTYLTTGIPLFLRTHPEIIKFIAASPKSNYPSAISIEVPDDLI